MCVMHNPTTTELSLPRAGLEEHKISFKFLIFLADTTCDKVEFYLRIRRGRHCPTLHITGYIGFLPQSSAMFTRKLACCAESKNLIQTGIVSGVVRLASLALLPTNHSARHFVGEFVSAMLHSRGAAGPASTCHSITALGQARSLPLVDSRTSNCACYNVCH